MRSPKGPIRTEKCIAPSCRACCTAVNVHMPDARVIFVRFFLYYFDTFGFRGDCKVSWRWNTFQVAITSWIVKVQGIRGPLSF